MGKTNVAVHVKNPPLKKQDRNVREVVSKFSLPLVLLAMWAVMFFIDSRFLSVDNISNLGRQTAIIGIVAIAQTLVIITKGIDLSVGATLGISSVITAQLLVNETSVLMTVVIISLIGLLIGVINGVLIYDAKITPFIATLGTMTIIRGATLLTSEGRIISGVPREVTQLAESTFLGIPFLLVVMIIIAGIGALVIRYTVFGRNLFSIGSSEESARLSGVNVRMTTYGAYGIAGILSAIAGFLLTTRLASGIPTAGEGYELDAIASAVIGGASLFGAQGSIIGTVIGSFIMSTLRNAGNLLGIQPFWLQIAIGGLLLAVVFFDQIQKRKS
ncbi:ABC transporter permease [Rossellomorea vietnamensis]|uniref:ABC transporter permease n=1 Tax=Rossellomorea vietnamensis TaxID=218284 RepID=UPI001E3B710A|nr:ABC transporter permease [Rossellomorea vietnamensis]MCC5801771.1 ABC transporter permease [Rossellomorea vietnamensis]